MTQPNRHRDDPGQGFIALVRSLAENAGPDGMTLREIRDRLDERAFGLMILILAIPCLVPALYGVPQIVGIPILLLAGQMLVGRTEPWLPQAVLRRSVSKAWLDRMADFATKSIVLPMTNTVPSVALTLLSVGLIQRDGLFVLGGATVAVGWVTALLVVAIGFFVGAGWAVGLAARFGL